MLHVTLNRAIEHAQECKYLLTIIEMLPLTTNSNHVLVAHGGSSSLEYGVLVVDAVIGWFRALATMRSIPTRLHSARSICSLGWICNLV
jgi:hypothetical protein